MKDWPVWYPGLDLKAEHLIGLEDYLLARTAIADEPGYGIEEFDWKISVHASRHDQSLDIRISGVLRGITPGGQPVVLSADEILSGVLEAQGLDTQFDLWIEIVPGLKSAPTSQPQRCALILDLAQPSGAPVLPYQHSERLYLGRYQYRDDGSLDLVHRPLVRRLASLKPLDRSWESWVDPFSSRITTLLKSLEQGAPGDPYSLILFSEISRLAFDWPTTCLPNLARRLSYVSWLQSQGQTPKNESNLPARLQERFPPDSVSGQELPHTLAGLLQAEAHPRNLPELLRQLQGAIYWHVPLDAFRQWKEQVSSFQDQRGLDQVAEALRQRSARREFDDWSRAVGLITMAILEHFRRHQWPRDLLTSYLLEGADSLGASALEVLHRLYGDKAQEAPAGPLGFYCLADAATKVPTFVGSRPADLNVYLGLLASQEALPDSLDPKLRSKDRVLAHLIARRIPTPYAADVVSAGPPLFQPWMATRGVRRSDRVIRIAVIGDSGSGKSTLLRAYAGLQHDSAASRGKFAANLSRLPSRADQLVELRGEIDLGGAEFQLRIWEMDGRAFHDGGEHRSLDSRAEGVQDLDLLIIAIETASVDLLSQFGPTKLFQDLAGAAKLIRNANPMAMIGIAYTKADEYGVVDPKSLRVVELEAQIALLDQITKMQGRPSDNAWKAFVRSVAPQRAGDWWNMTRGFVLNQTQKLWEQILSDGRGDCPAINGYFVSADPLDDYLRPWPRRGLLQLFNDFFEYFQTMRF